MSMSHRHVRVVQCPLTDLWLVQGSATPDGPWVHYPEDSYDGQQVANEQALARYDLARAVNGMDPISEPTVQFALEPSSGNA